jgi:hypothetical protein
MVSMLIIALIVAITMLALCAMPIAAGTHDAMH